MKRLICLTVTLLLLPALAACGGSGAGTGSGSGSPSADASAGGDVYAEGGYGEGRIGDVIHSIFMDFSVNSAYTTADYHGHAAPEDRQVLVVEMTVKNTSRETLPMWDNDFQAQWTASAETDEYAWPVTMEEDPVADEQLPTEYKLAVGESRTGTLVFDVPADERDFSISHMELFDDNSEGDTFFVYFTAESK